VRTSEAFQLAQNAALALGLTGGRQVSLRNAASHGRLSVTHRHEHAAHGHPAAEDGLHTHTHTHANDGGHDHDHEDLTGSEEYYNPDGPDLRLAAARAARFTFGDQARRQQAMIAAQELRRGFR